MKRIHFVAPLTKPRELLILEDLCEFLPSFFSIRDIGPKRMENDKPNETAGIIFSLEGTTFSIEYHPGFYNNVGCICIETFDGTKYTERSCSSIILSVFYRELLKKKYNSKKDLM